VLSVSGCIVNMLLNTSFNFNTIKTAYYFKNSPENNGFPSTSLELEVPEDKSRCCFTWRRENSEAVAPHS